jgi:predicted aldo/keto reductase-like oxidoreductase
MAADWVKVGHKNERLQEENDGLQAAIERVRALHRSGLKGAVCDECEYYYPCPTLRALDGEGA